VEFTQLITTVPSEAEAVVAVEVAVATVLRGLTMEVMVVAEAQASYLGLGVQGTQEVRGMVLVEVLALIPQEVQEVPKGGATMAEQAEQAEVLARLVVPGLMQLATIVV